MYCAGCGYQLSESVDAVERRCSECGRPFDPSEPRTWEKRRHPPRLVLGLVSAFLLLVLGLGGVFLAMQPIYGHDYTRASMSIAGVGFLGALVAVLLAVRNRSWWGRIPLLGVGVLLGWAGIAMGVDHGFRVWQSAPNPPDEAFADGAKAMFAVLAGWLPSGVVVGIVFAVLLPFFSGMRRLPSRTNMGTKADSRTAPPTEPNAS